MKRRPWDATNTYETDTLYTFLTAGRNSYVLDLHFTFLHIEFDKISIPVILQQFHAIYYTTGSLWHSMSAI